MTGRHSQATPTQVLLNHVVGAALESGDLSGYASTLYKRCIRNNMSIYIDTADGVRFNGVSSVSAATINANNGVIHLVDAVIGLPRLLILPQQMETFLLW